MYKLFVDFYDNKNYIFFLFCFYVPRNSIQKKVLLTLDVNKTIYIIIKICKNVDLKIISAYLIIFSEAKGFAYA